MSNLGSFSNGGLGFGVAFTLEDEFSQVAREVEKSMAGLDGHAATMAANVDKSLNQMRVGTTMLAGGVALLSPFLANLDNFSDLQESISKSSVVFGDSVNKVTDFINNQAVAYGQSKQQSLEAIGTYGNLFTSLGLGQKVAAGYSVELNKLAADLASFNNTEVDQSINALRSAMSGEFEAAKRFGIAINADLLKAKALQLGVIKSVKEKLTPLAKIQAAYALVMEQTKNAQGDFIRTSDGYANSLRILNAKWTNMKTLLGGVVMPIALRLVKIFGGMADGMAAFLSTGIGQGLMTIIAAFGAFLIVAGSVLLITGASRFAIFKMAGAFAGATRATIIQTIAQKGMLAGLKMMVKEVWILSKAMIVGMVGSIKKSIIWLTGLRTHAKVAFTSIKTSAMAGVAGLRTFAVAAWAAITPMLPFIAIGAAIAAPFIILWVTIKKATKAFNDMEAPTNGFLGFLQRLGGYVAVIRAVWRSWDSLTRTFSLTADLEAKLKSLGIFDTAMAIATWVVRVKEFFNGMREGISAAWGMVKSFAASFRPVLDFTLEFFDRIGINIGKNTSDINKWQQAGKTAGIVIVSTLAAIAVSFIALGVSAIIGMWPIIAVVGLIGAAIWGVLQIAKNWDQWWDSLKDWGGRLFDTGKSMVTNLWDGMKSMMGEFITWIDQSLSSIPLIGEMYKGAKFVGETTAFLVGEGISGVTGMENPIENPIGNIGLSAAKLNGAVAAAGTVGANRDVAVNAPPVSMTNNIILDGDVIHKNMVEKNEFNNSRQ